MSKRRSFVFESEIIIKAAQRGIYSTAVAIPAVYAQNARPSHFRGVRDISLITLMVAWSLITRGFYPQGLYRAVIKPHLLPSYKGRLDYAGYLMALLSLFVMLATAGLSLLAAFIYVWRLAHNSSPQSEHRHILILGKQLQNEVPDADYRLRLDRAAAIYTENAEREFYLLGGVTGNAEISESRAGYQYLATHGVPTQQMHCEEQSRNTLENLYLLRHQIDVSKTTFGLITNRYHLARACMMAKQFSYRVQACAAEGQVRNSFLRLLRYLGEAFLLHWYMTGFIYARLTNNRAMLIRIKR